MNAQILKQFYEFSMTNKRDSEGLIPLEQGAMKKRTPPALYSSELKGLAPKFSFSGYQDLPDIAFGMFGTWLLERIQVDGIAIPEVERTITYINEVYDHNDIERVNLVEIGVFEALAANASISDRFQQLLSEEARRAFNRIRAWAGE